MRRTARRSWARQLKRECHEVFDRLWFGPDRCMSRAAAYAWLSVALDVPVDECHFALLPLSKLRVARDLCRSRLDRSVSDKHGAKYGRRARNEADKRCRKRGTRRRYDRAAMKRQSPDENA